MKFYIVDCFAEEKYQGNELLVVKVDRPISDEEQQKIAREINFSETAFILSDKKDDGGYDVRIWTPNVGEMPFAGHPTLGTAHIIRYMYEGGTNETVRLNLKVGQISVRVTDDGMTMSQNPPEFGEIVSREEIADIYGLEAADIRDDYPIQWVSTGLEAVIIPLRTRAALQRLLTDKDKFMAYVKRHPKNYCNHLFFVDMGDNIIAARCLMEDFIEDPATGSANGDLAGYMIQHSFFGSNDVKYTVVQGEDMGRKSILHVHAALNGDNWLIEVGGNCFVVAEGDWM
ncbi:MAG: PhzF family phenazine biosynthesis protein [Lachnospiraceae bacterium]|nr:PhzF family phenazine biosynthesis protein [Lachnospiraceae bacterium]